jgi:hypothetical protein
MLNVKFQTPNPKSQTNFNLQFLMTQTVLFWILVIGAYLEFDAWDLVLISLGKTRKFIATRDRISFINI